MYKEKLLGFDAREMWLDLEALWPQKRRKIFLLKRDIEKPLAIDPGVWPSVFDIDANHAQGRQLNSMKRKREYQTEHWNTIFKQAKPLSTPSWTGPRIVWDNLQRLKDHLRSTWGDMWKPCWIIGVTEVVDITDPEVIEEYSHYDIVPDQLSQNWELLGYDVADFYGTSFVSNAGYLEFEFMPLHRRWSPHLNRHHLFAEQKEALGYVAVAYERDRQHGPFSAYGLYLIEKLDAG